MNVHVISELPRTHLGEGPLWDSNKLLYVDIAEGSIHRHSFSEHTHETISIGENVGFAVVDTAGGVIAGLGNGAIYQLRFDSHARELLAQPARDLRENLANDGKCDRSGRLWTGTKNRNERAADTGYLARFDAGSRLTEVLYPVHISNGLAWSPDNTKLYYNDSTSTIWQFDYDIESGTISRRHAWVQLPNDGAVPDGMTVDSQGSLYVAMWGGSRVDIYREKNGTGSYTDSIKIPTALQISSVAFGGSDLRTLFITSAAAGLTLAQKDRYPDSGRVFAIEMPYPGLPETRFDFSKFASSKACD